MLLLIFKKKGIAEEKGQLEVYCYLVGDIIILSLYMIYVLMMDTRMFGSGLKEVLKLKTRRIKLS
jgi:hypothetical protein